MIEYITDTAGVGPTYPRAEFGPDFSVDKRCRNIQGSI